MRCFVVPVVQINFGLNVSINVIHRQNNAALLFMIDVQLTANRSDAEDIVLSADWWHNAMSRLLESKAVESSF